MHTGIQKSQDLMLTRAALGSPPACPVVRPSRWDTGRLAASAPLMPSSPVLPGELMAGVLPQPRRESSRLFGDPADGGARDDSLTLRQGMQPN